MSSNKKRYSKIMTTEFYLLLFLVAILIFLGIFAKGFYDMNNIMSLLNRYSYILIAAIGMNMIIITSNIDVSAGALISVICVVVGFMGKAGLPLGVFLPVAMAVGAILSTLNGLFITKLRIPSIVVTLATTQIFQGVLPLVVDGSIYDLPPSFTWLAYEAKILGIIPASVLIMIIITALTLVFMKYSKFSKQLYAIGNNQNGARLAGVNVDKVVVLSYTIAGILFGITATIIATGSQRVTTTMSNGLEMTFIAAVVLGGTSTAGGSGKVIGTVIGAFILSLVSPAINYLGISPDWSDAIMGGIIILSVVASALNIKKKRKIGLEKEVNNNGKKEVQTNI